MIEHVDDRLNAADQRLALPGPRARAGSIIEIRKDVAAQRPGPRVASERPSSSMSGFRGACAADWSEITLLPQCSVAAVPRSPSPPGATCCRGSIRMVTCESGSAAACRRWLGGDQHLAPGNGRRERGRDDQPRGASLGGLDCERLLCPCPAAPSPTGRRIWLRKAPGSFRGRGLCSSRLSTNDHPVSGNTLEFR